MPDEDTVRKSLLAFVGCILFPSQIQALPPLRRMDEPLTEDDVLQPGGLLLDLFRVYNRDPEDAAVLDAVRQNLPEVVYGTANFLSEVRYPFQETQLALGDFHRWDSQTQDMMLDLSFELKECAQRSSGWAHLHLLAVKAAARESSNVSVRTSVSGNTGGEAEIVHKFKPLSPKAEQHHEPATFFISNPESARIVVSLVEKKSFGRKHVVLHTMEICLKSCVGASPMWGTTWSKEIEDDVFKVSVDYSYRDFSAFALAHPRSIPAFLLTDPQQAYDWLDFLVMQALQSQEEKEEKEEEPPPTNPLRHDKSGTPRGLFSEGLLFVIDQFCHRYAVLRSHLPVAACRAFSNSVFLCVTWPEELCRFFSEARAFCTATKSSPHPVLSRDVKIFEETSVTLMQKVEEMFSCFKSYPILALRSLLELYRQILFMEDDDEKFSTAISDHVRDGVIMGYDCMKIDANLDLEGPSAFVWFARMLLSSLEKDLDIYAADVFPPQMDYPSLVIECLAPRIREDFDHLSRRNFGNKFDSSLFQLSSELQKVVQFVSRNFPRSPSGSAVFLPDISAVLRPHFDIFLGETRENMRKWISAAFLADSWLSLSDTEKHSSSIVDTGKLCETLREVLLSSSLPEFSSKMFDLICESLLSYATLVQSAIRTQLIVPAAGRRHKPGDASDARSTLSSSSSSSLTSPHSPAFLPSSSSNASRSSSESGRSSGVPSSKPEPNATGDDGGLEDDDGDSEATASIPVKLNCIFKASEIISSFRDRDSATFTADDVFGVDAAPGDNVDGDPPSLLSDSQRLLLDAEKRCLRILLDAVDFVCETSTPNIREALIVAASRPEDRSLLPDGRCAFLFSVLENLLGMHSDLLYPDVFKRYQRRLMQIVCLCIEDLVAGDFEAMRLHDYDGRHVAVLESLLPAVVDFFYVDGERITEKFVDNTLASTRLCLQFAALPTAKLIELFHKFSDSDESDALKANVVLNVLESRSGRDKDASSFCAGASQKIDLQVQKLFDLPKGEQGYSKYSCRLNEESTGKLYITSRHVCFREKACFRGSGTKLVLPIASLADVEVVDKALLVTMDDQTLHVFSGFAHGKRKLAFDDILMRAVTLGTGLSRDQRMSQSISPDRSKSLCKKFGLDPARETLYQTFSCLVRVVIPVTLYVFTETIVLHSTIPLIGKQYLVRFSDVIRIHKLTLQGLEIHAADGMKILVTGLLNRESAFKCMQLRLSFLQMPFRLSVDNQSLCRDGSLLKSSDDLLAASQRDAAASEGAHRLIEEAAAISIQEDAASARVMFGISDLSETYFDRYRCRRGGELGFLYVFRRHLCFDSILFSQGASRLVFPLDHLRGLSLLKNAPGIQGKAIVLLDKDRKSIVFDDFVHRRECYRSIKILAAAAGAVFLDQMDDDDEREMKEQRHLQMFKRLGLNAEEEEVFVEFACFSGKYLKGTLFVTTNFFVFDPLFMKSHAIVERYINIKCMRKPSLMRLSLEFIRFDDSRFSLRGFRRRNDVFAAVLRCAQLLGHNLETSRPSEEALRKRKEAQRQMLVDKFGIPSSEQIIAEYFCMYGVHSGYLFVTSSHLCFDSPFGAGRDNMMLCVSLASVAEVSPFRKAVIFPSGLAVRMIDGRIIDLHGFFSRDAALKTIRERLNDVRRVIEG